MAERAYELTHISAYKCDTTFFFFFIFNSAYAQNYSLIMQAELSVEAICLNFDLDIHIRPYRVYYIAFRSLYRHVVCNVLVSLNGDKNQLGTWRYSDPKAD